jgi:hypothetical protein
VSRPNRFSHSLIFQTSKQAARFRLGFDQTCPGRVVNGSEKLQRLGCALLDDSGKNICQIKSRRVRLAALASWFAERPEKRVRVSYRSRDYLLTNMPATKEVCPFTSPRCRLCVRLTFPIRAPRDLQSTCKVSFIFSGHLRLKARCSRATGARS